MVEVLVQQGASLDHQDELHGNTALHEAAWKGFSGTVSSLCQAKANVYMKNRGGFTALHLCCQVSFTFYKCTKKVSLFYKCAKKVSLFTNHAE